MRAKGAQPWLGKRIAPESNAFALARQVADAIPVDLLLASPTDAAIMGYYRLRASDTTEIGDWLTKREEAAGITGMYGN